MSDAPVPVVTETEEPLLLFTGLYRCRAADGEPPLDRTCGEIIEEDREPRHRGPIDDFVLDAPLLTWEEIVQRYPDQWVLVVEMEWDDDFFVEPSRAKVIGHAARYDDALDQGGDSRSHYVELALYCTRPPCQTREHPRADHCVPA